MQNELICCASKALWIVAIIILINVGIEPFGYNLFQTELFQTTLDWLVNPLHYIAGIAGLLGLYRLIMKLVHGQGSLCGCSGKGACPCGRPNCNCR